MKMVNAEIITIIIVLCIIGVILIIRSKKSPSGTKKELKSDEVAEQNTAVDRHFSTKRFSWFAEYEDCNIMKDQFTGILYVNRSNRINAYTVLCNKEGKPMTETEFDTVIE